MSNLPNKDAANCAWSDHRREYGVSVNGSVRMLEHKAFHAGWDAALAELGDVIVIPRADLPKVDARGGVLIAELDVEERGAAAEARLDRDVPNSHAEWHRAKANAHLALAEYLDAHPPVDEAQVDALTDALVAAVEAKPTNGVVWPEGSAEAFARRLLATRRVTVTPEDGPR